MDEPKIDLGYLVTIRIDELKEALKTCYHGSIRGMIEDTLSLNEKILNALRSSQVP